MWGRQEEGNLSGRVWGSARPIADPVAQCGARERRASWGRLEGPGAGTLTQATTSLRAAASNSRVGVTPGNNSGLGRLLNTAWASERSRATRRSRAQVCEDTTELVAALPLAPLSCPHPGARPKHRPHRGPRGVPPWAEGAVAWPPAQCLFLLGWGMGTREG